MTKKVTVTIEAFVEKTSIPELTDFLTAVHEISQILPDEIEVDVNIEEWYD